VRVFKDMRAAGVLPNTVTYNTLITACANGRQWQEALRVFKDMRAAGVLPNTITYNTLITACANGGQWREAVRVFKDMRAAGVLPNTITYSTLITACANGGQWQEAVRVFEDMRAAGVLPDTTTYSTLITACANGGQWREAVRVFKDMRAAGVLPDTTTFSTLIEATANSGKMDVALQFYDMGAKSGCFQNYLLLDDQLPSNNGREVSAAVASGDMARTGRGVIYTIDLHVLSEIGSQVCLLSWLRHLRRHRELLAGSDITNLHIITGWGKHAEAGVSKVMACPLLPIHPTASRLSNSSHVQLHTKISISIDGILGFTLFG
jgi:pentatricopeptide repeat domain-containing protein 1